jgi:ketosteroid isomerase-like protein
MEYLWSRQTSSTPETAHLSAQMKYLTAILLLTSAACASSQPRSRPDTEAGEVARAVRAVEEEWNAAIKRRDAKAMQRFLAPGYFLAVGVQGRPLQVVPRENWLRNLELYDIQSFSIDDMKVSVYGETAVATMLITQKAVVGRERRDRSAQFFITDVWVRHADGWRVAERHSSRPEQPVSR